MHLVDDLAGYVRKESRDVQKGAILFSSSEDGILIGWDETREYLNTRPGVHAVITLNLTGQMQLKQQDFRHLR